MLRLLSWNVRDLLGDPLAVIRVIRSAEADLVCLQEAPRWPGSRSRLAGLARATGLLMVGGGRSSAGTAMLASPRLRVGEVHEGRLPTAGRLTRPRGVVLADCRVPGAGGRSSGGGGPLAVASVHLPLEPRVRVEHATAVRDLVLGRGLPAVVAGDLNEPPAGPAWQAFAPLVDPWPAGAATFPASRPRRRIDAVLVGPGVRAEAEPHWRPDRADVVLATDHWPVLAVLNVD